MSMEQNKSKIENIYDEELNELMKRRREELEQLKALGIEPYPYEFHRTDFSKDIIENFKDELPSQNVSVAGRIMSIRRMGKATFCHIQDSKGKIQIYLKKDDIGAKYDTFKLLDIGDIIGVEGFVFRTKMGEISVHARNYELLSKSLRPLPVVKEKIDEKGNKHIYDPFADKELRYRQRYIDLVVNPNVKDIFIKRAKVINSIRMFLEQQNYIEVETPILQPLYGGAFARPFKTHHNVLDIDLYLRIANELYLKRLIVGGYDGVYEFAKDFRNEGMDRLHNPEFTMLEVYVAYKDYKWMMSFVEEMICYAAKLVNNTLRWKVGSIEIDFTPPWKRISFFDSIKQYIGYDVMGKSEQELRTICKQLQLEIGLSAGQGEMYDEIFSTFVQPNLLQPTFVVDYPLEMSPLAKKHRSIPGLVERFEVIINGYEICNAFSELNDPLEQRIRFEEQAKLRARGNEETHTFDEDFLRALEYGMPPTAGLGIGIDRLVMLFLNQASIRDVIFFPQMRPEK